MDDRLLDWLIGNVLCMLLWLPGYGGQRARETNEKEVRVPRCVTRLSCSRSDDTVRVHSFGTQLLGLLLFVMNSLLALFVPSHSMRVDLFAVGMIGLLVLIGFVVLIMRRL
jgi:hypothetical protein